jgi:hypothetical protein
MKERHGLASANGYKTDQGLRSRIGDESRASHVILEMHDS